MGNIKNKVMPQYISKPALVAEIERRIKEGEAVVENVPSSAIFGLIQAYKNVLSFLDTLEVKEEEPAIKDLEEAAKNHKSAIHIVSPQWTSEVEKAFMAGAQWQKEKTIKMAQDWLTDNYDKYIITNGLATMFKATIDFDTIKMVEDFKNYMNN